MYSSNFAHNSKKYSYLAFKNTEIRSKNKRRNKAETLTARHQGRQKVRKKAGEKRSLKLHSGTYLEVHWTVAHQAPLPMEFFRQEYWSGLPFPSQGDLPNPGIKLPSPALAGGFFTTEPPGK